MNARGKNGQVFMRTYSKRMRKVEPWFSPDLKKAAFSFSSTPSDQSIPEATQPKKRRMRETASRKAKSKRMTDIKEKESDEENYAPSLPYRKKTNAKPSVRTTAVRETRTTKQLKRNIQSVLSSSENEDDSLMKKIFTRTSEEECADAEKVSDPTVLGRYVTHHKRPLPSIQAQKHTNKQISVALHRTINSSDDFLPLFSCKKGLASRKPFSVENRSSNKPTTNKNRKHSKKREALGEVSFNDSDEQHLPGKCPLLSSTPSLVCGQLLHLPEPSISEISSLSFDELYQSTKTNKSTHCLKNARACDRTVQKEGIQQLLNYTGERVMQKREGGEESVVEETAGDGERDQRKEGCAGETSSQASTGFAYVSPLSNLESLAEELKERCRTVDVAIMLNRINISDHLSVQRCSMKRVEKISSYCSVFSMAATSQCNQTHAAVSSSHTSLSKPSLTPLYISSSSSKSLSTSRSPETVCPSQPLIDRLKAECLLSCLIVGIPRLDLDVHPDVHQGAAKAPCFDSPYICQRDSATSPPVKETESCNASLKSHRTPRNIETVVRRLSASFQPPPGSPPASAAPSKARPPAVPKERTGAGTGTGRKVCVSGQNVSRWSKRSTREHNEKWKTKEGRTKGVSGDYSSWSSILSAGADTNAVESVCGWLQGTSGISLALTPLRKEQMSLSSILTNFTPDTLTTHSWGRFKAALSVHKKKTAFPTPRRLVLSHLKTPSSRFPVDTSLDLFASPVCTTLSRLTPSRLLRSTINTPRTPYDEDISDAEKVYQECQQIGPLLFSDCIPPSRMKLCNKIGEGTFGEVFSTINDSNQTVALKIIPVEGNQKVNGEQQKTFGEILHEIIISKELSCLNSKEINKTDGFIGLNNLHCVRGRYPKALLKAWDKFDRQKGSENDRPGFVQGP
ncbi:uncharacterized protein LOC127443631 isoform X2 [Myxocyprinus asiaticus]|uniref:uncharacterized protein LOC127443631 isoform X2 n=1 Tax=Myxocyprinus asiaticus TaxID=70543 RepID=UPI002221E7A7|nr:uncharacterized protein LOC127443631 isoform X2 [Myxocyprinus asiaticus]